MPDPNARDQVAARMMLVALCLSWGLTWPAMRIALSEIPPFSMRASSVLIGAMALLVIALATGTRLRVPNLKTWAQIFLVSLFNVVIFSICSAFAQLNAMTSRVTILAYTMPIWASLLAGPVLGERMTRTTWIALGLCCAGLAILIYPLAGHGIPIGLMLALGCAISWSIGTIYMKWAKIDAAPLAIAMWQLAMGCIVIAAFIPIVEGSLHIEQADVKGWLAVIFAGVFGSGLAYYLWFRIIKIMPAVTASLGAQASPVVGVVSSVLILGDRPTVTDIAGFALILAASICILLQPQAAPIVQGEPI